MSESLYTWDGTYFGKRRGDSLYSHHGVEVGRFHGDEVFGSDGAYIGELKNGKLITKQSKASTQNNGFSSQQSDGKAGYAGHSGTGIYAGYEDFPSPESFK